MAVNSVLRRPMNFSNIPLPPECLVAYFDDPPAEINVARETISRAGAVAGAGVGAVAAGVG